MVSPSIHRMLQFDDDLTVDDETSPSTYHYCSATVPQPNSGNHVSCPTSNGGDPFADNGSAPNAPPNNTCPYHDSDRIHCTCDHHGDPHDHLIPPSNIIDCASHHHPRTHDYPPPYHHRHIPTDDNDSDDSKAGDVAWENMSPLLTTLPPAYDAEMDDPPTPHTTAFPASAIVAIVAGVLAVLVTAGVVAYYRRRYRQMSLQYLRNMQSTAWTFDDTTVDNDSHAPSGPPRSPSMSIWTNPNRPASEFSSGVKSHWQRHAIPSPSSAADYQTRRARLPSLQTEVNHEALRHNGWYHASSAGDAARVSKPAASWHHAAPGSSIESLSRLDPAQRMHMNRQGHNLVYDNHQASYVSTNDPECNSAISFKSSGSTPRPTTKRSTRGENHLSMSSWDDP